MRILCWGTYDVGKPRARLLLKGLRENGATVLECHADIWRGVTDKSQVRGVRRQSGILLRWLLSYPRLAWQLARAPRPDVILIGFPGILDMLVAAPIARLRGIPLVWDMFMSIYDTVVEDRRLLRAGGFAARTLHAVESFALRRADLVFLDTRAHARRIERLFSLVPNSVGAIWVGCETEYFYPRPAVKREAMDAAHDLRVLFYGQFIPLHGIDTIIRAARLMRGDPVQWTLVGVGQETARIDALLAEQPLPKVHRTPWVDYAELPSRIAEADVCLGIFGSSEKAASVIPNKVFQIVAMGRPLITRDSAAIREMLEHHPPCVSLVPPDDPDALAAAIRAMIAQRVAASPCHTALEGKLDAGAIGHQLLDMMQERAKRGTDTP
jgi:glycosyltransferase involved in cell wall biosynthesis